MRNWPPAACRHVINFTVFPVSMFLISACGGGTDTQGGETDSDSYTEIPTSTLTDAAVLSTESEVYKTVDLTDSDLTSTVELGSAIPTTELLAPPPPASIDTEGTVDATEIDIASVDSTVITAESTTTEASEISTVSETVEVTEVTDTVAVTEVSETAEVTEVTDTVEETEVSETAETSEVTDTVEVTEVTETVEIPEATDTVEITEVSEEAEVPVATVDPDEPEELASALPTSQFYIGSAVGDVEKIISNLQSSKSQTNVQQTPIAVANGHLYTANIEHGPNGDVAGYDLKTIIRQGTQNESGEWEWKSHLVEDRTIHDQWHTAPSVEIDKDGLVHIVYNLHNFPWQYKRTTQPHDLDTFEFRGQEVSDEEIRLSAEENKTSFPTLGKADIPGNQITYPAFFKDRNNDLYVSYRFGATPKQGFADRTMSAGVSVYNSVTQTWAAIGGNVALTSDDYDSHSDAADESIAIAAMRGWTNYHPRVVFDQNNKMFVNWFWRDGVAGAKLTRPCIVSTTDRSTFYDSSNNFITVPVDPTQCGNLGYSDSQEFYSVGNTAINSLGEVHIVLSPDGDTRKIVSYDMASGEWQREDSPSNSVEIFFDEDDTQWAIATGIRIYKKTAGSSSWQTVYDDSGSDNCYPKATVTEDMKYAFIHAEACDTGSVSVYGLRLK